MINLNGERGSGKTTQIIKLANTSYELGHNPVVIVPGLTAERFYKGMGLNDNIAVITPRFYLEHKEYFKDRDIFIDEAEYLLKSIFNYGNLAVITTEKENIKEIKREDWDKDYALDKMMSTVLQEVCHRFGIFDETLEPSRKENILKAVEKLLKEIQND